MRRTYRLRQHNDIQAVRQSGQRCKHPLAILLFKPNQSQNSRFAFIAGRHIGNAVQRNRAKRLLREAVRLHLDEIAEGWDCLFIVRHPTPQATFADVEAAVLYLLKRAHMLNVRGRG